LVARRGFARPPVAVCGFDGRRVETTRGALVVPELGCAIDVADGGRHVTGGGREGAPVTDHMPRRRIEAFGDDAAVPGRIGQDSQGLLAAAFEPEMIRQHPGRGERQAVRSGKAVRRAVVAESIG
jgi:hypothetical protein